MSSSSAAPRQEVAHQKGVVSAENYEARLKEVLKEVKKASRPNEPQFIDLGGIYAPDFQEGLRKYVHSAADDPEEHEKKMKVVVYPYPSIIITNVPEHYRQQPNQGWRDFEKCKLGRIGKYTDFENVLLTLAIKAKDPEKGITRRDFMEEMHAYEGGEMCGWNGSPREFLEEGHHDSCGRYRLESRGQQQLVCVQSRTKLP
ncbi:unnamed protein product [Vitrella brassicaformis CCMP3155]|uniref:Uncharacterized protein n=1 Tax=Vitrella brassicaformis (strain CCMP3155) TaxID=1169540 RepID=A0A0G4EQJ3_VITBC|nr:unnamed protein product [Vitrella brassicaformis CCMP3155]|eukprot:CEL99709.1 unnamed protein product [Vitrella brassicaformis CCMP3155]